MNCVCVSEPGQVYYRQYAPGGYDGASCTVMPAAATLDCAVLTVLLGAYAQQEADVDAGVELWWDGYWHPYVAAVTSAGHIYPAPGTPIPGGHAVSLQFSVAGPQVAQLSVKDETEGESQVLSVGVPSPAWYPGSAAIQQKLLVGIVPATPTSSQSGQQCEQFSGSAAVQVRGLALAMDGQASPWLSGDVASCSRCPGPGYALPNIASGGQDILVSLSTSGQVALQPAAQPGPPLWAFLVGGAAALAMAGAGVLVWRRAA